MVKNTRRFERLVSEIYWGANRLRYSLLTHQAKEFIECLRLMERDIKALKKEIKNGGNSNK